MALQRSHSLNQHPHQHILLLLHHRHLLHLLLLLTPDHTRPKQKSSNSGTPGNPDL